MRIYWFRHGETAYNAERRYQGRCDIPLSEKGRAALRPAGIAAQRVYVSPLLRARQTAEALFPGAEQQTVEALTEMDFGRFDGRSAAEMERDPAYRAWVESGCTGRCPGGEDLEEFTERTCVALAALVEEAAQRGDEALIVVAHGGTLMAGMARFALPQRQYFEWMVPCGCGYLLTWEERLWRERKKLRFAQEIRCTGNGKS